MCIVKVTITNDTHVAASVLFLICDIFNVGRSYVKKPCDLRHDLTFVVDGRQLLVL